jgi:phenylacetate-CoA ligase
MEKRTMNGFPRQQVIRLYQKATGRHILEYMDELNRSQWLSRDELLDRQRGKLHQLLEYVYANVPYYQRLFDDVGFRPVDVLEDPSAMHNIPLLTKAIIRENLDSLLTTDSTLLKEMITATTSGSTGQPLIYKQDNNCRDFAMAALYRHFTWSGWQLGQCYAWIWGAVFEQKTSQTFRSKTRDWILNRFETNAFYLSEERMRDFAAQVRRRRPKIIRGYPSSLCFFAEFVREHALEDIRFDAVFTAAETLYPSQRQFIEEVFGAEVFDYYATLELGGLAGECETHSGLHVNVENIYIEILQNGKPAEAGDIGDVVVTNLNNYGMPFIRYSVEDTGAWSEESHCPCGRGLPIMDLKLARTVDTFKTRDGRVLYGGFAHRVFNKGGVKRFQLVQKSLDHVVARIERDADLDEAKLSKMESDLKLALGEQVSVTFEFPEEIPVYDSGKYRYVISEVDEI